jgi:hypothetical protein
MDRVRYKLAGAGVSVLGGMLASVIFKEATVDRAAAHGAAKVTGARPGKEARQPGKDA